MRFVSSTTVLNPTDSVSLIARHSKASISRPEQTSNADFRFVNSSNFSSFGVTFINVSAVRVSIAHARNETSIPKPAASTATTSAKSSTKVRIRSCRKTGFRNTSAYEMTIRPAHRMTVVSSNFWILKVNTVPPLLPTTLLPIRDITSYGPMSSCRRTDRRQGHSEFGSSIPFRRLPY